MIERLDNIKLNISESEDKLIEIAKKKCGGHLGYFKILKKSLDARDKTISIGYIPSRFQKIPKVKKNAFSKEFRYRKKSLSSAAALRDFFVR